MARPIATEAQLDAAFAPLFPVFQLSETEDTWDRIDKALAQLQSLTKQGATKVSSYIAHIRDIAPCITRSLLSDRTKLSGTASDVINSMAPRLGERFAALLSVFLPPLLQLCARTNKVALRRAEKSLHLICHHCRLPQAIPYFGQALRDKSTTLRTTAASCLVILLEELDRGQLSKRVEDIEHAIQILAADAHPQARTLGRQMYALYAGLWPERRPSLFETLGATAQRYLSSVSAAMPKSTQVDDAQETTRTVLRVSRLPSQGVPVSRDPPHSQRVVMPEKERENMDVAPQENDARMPATSWADPFAKTGVPPLPPKGSSPSDGIAYRLALAREQAKLRASQRHGTAQSTELSEARLLSRALLRPTASLGGARRVAVSRPAMNVSTPPQKAPSDKLSSLHAAGHVSTRKQFTPQRRPFGVINDDRSPDTKRMHGPTSPWASMNT